MNAPSAAITRDRPAVFITGAAAGIGRAVAERFAQAGRLDVSQPDDWAQQLQAFAQASGGRLDLLVNNAGISVTRPFEEVELARHHRLIDVNLKGVINGCHGALPYLKRTPASRVVDVLPLFVDTAMVRDDVSRMKTVQTLGVRLTADDVALTIWRLSQARPASLPVHSPVGWQASIFYVLAKCTPDVINRWVTARMAGL
jgi:short chain dehydrogenase